MTDGAVFHPGVFVLRFLLRILILHVVAVISVFAHKYYPIFLRKITDATYYYLIRDSRSKSGERGDELF